nr:MAG TPA: hypothetical protein [Caudoviricetes sp.]
MVSLVKNANHGFDLINFSFQGTTSTLRLFTLYSGTTEGMNVIPRENLETNLNEYQGGSILTHEGQNYRLAWYRNFNFDEGQMQAGGTYALVTNDHEIYVIRLDAEKYPDLGVSDWKWIRSRSLRPILKFAIVKDQQELLTANKIYYLNSGANSTKIISPDTITDSTLYEDSSVNLLPTFTLISGTVHCTINTDASVNGIARIANRVNMQCDDQFNITNGIGDFGFARPVAASASSCDILFGFTKVATLQVDGE